MTAPLIILNPAARSGRAGNFVEVLQELRGNPVVRMTTRPREAEEFAREAVAQGFKKIVAAGGDGLINEVVNGIVSSSTPDSPPALGILPLGTMNVFASELQIPLDSLEAAWEVILENHFRHVDLARATHLETQQERFFVQLAGIGIDAEVLEETSSESKMAFGPVSYLFSFLKVLFKQQPTLLLRCEEEIERKGSSLLLGNGKFYGGAFPFFPEATLDDGHLHVLLLKHHHFWELLGNLPSLLIGHPKALCTVQYFKVKKLSITPQDSRFKIPFELDGEMVSHLPIKISIEKHKLLVLVS
ncbi:MAG: diacylglycerol kinase family lipid kinase [Verrucomicrobia bacterium]|nr:diacylglycerol kinase family lipid kinase [Verrucomicrobiota bacterium]